MSTSYRIHPSIGVARVGDSPDSFYLAPRSIGGLPVECDRRGNPAGSEARPRTVKRFRDSEGRIRRQAAQFRIFAYDDDGSPGREVTLGDQDIAKIEWTVHVANKKSAWWNFYELYGNTMPEYGGQRNSYEARSKETGNPTLRNASEQGIRQRKALITDPGPRTLRAGTGPQRVAFDARSVPPSYKKQSSFPGAGLAPFPVDSLGEMMIDERGRLVALGGYGNAAGTGSITSFAGADDFWDDVSDGPVTCRITLRGRPAKVIELKAWLIVGAPKVAPELVNVSTLDDVIYDMAVRFKNWVPSLYHKRRYAANGGWNPDFVADYERDVAPLFERMDDYQWVANVQPMTAFARPRFDPRDNSAATRRQRETFFSYFRRPLGLPKPSQYNRLTRSAPLRPDLPMMPLNSGTNSVKNSPHLREVEKFCTLTATQYYLLGQWAAGKFEVRDRSARPAGRRVYPQDRIDAGNSVGLPMSPGIEVTWSSWNPRIYDSRYPWQIKHRRRDYARYGLSPSRDETEGGGCEPGDLTKRMAIPWQSDFFDCTVQQINYTEPKINKTDQGIPLPPAFYAFWWPPQSPMFVLNGSWTAAEQIASGAYAGQQLQFNRGINSFSQMLKAWRYTGFVVNLTRGRNAEEYPFFAERERRDDQFDQASVGTYNMLSYSTGDGGAYVQNWFLKNPLLPTQPLGPGDPQVYGTDPWTPVYQQAGDGKKRSGKSKRRPAKRRSKATKRKKT